MTPHRYATPVSASARTVAAAVFRKKWLIAGTMVTAVLSAVVFSFILPDKYQSRMKILVRNVRAEAPVTAGTDVAVDRNEVSESQILSEIELLKSRDLLEELVKRAGLVRPEPNSDGSKDLEKAILKLEKELSISPVKKANMIEVSYSSSSPETATRVLANLSELYLEKHLRVHHPPGTYDFFKEQANNHERDLRAWQDRLSQFQKQKEVVDIQKQKELLLVRTVDVTAKLKDLDGSIQETDKRIDELQRQLDGMERRVVTQSRTLPNQYSAERLNTMLVELRNKRIQLLAKFQPADRVVKEIDEQIQSTTAALQKATQSTAVEQATDLNPLRQLLESDLTKAKVEQKGRVALRENLATQVVQFKDQLTRLENATTQHSELARQVQESENNYQLYAKKEEESRINDALDKQKFSNVSVAEAPTVPQSPSQNNRLLVIVAGFLIGSAISFGSVFVSELLRESVLTPRELEYLTGRPVVATLALRKGVLEELDICDENGNWLDPSIPADVFDKFANVDYSTAYTAEPRADREGSILNI